MHQAHQQAYSLWRGPAVGRPRLKSQSSDVVWGAHVRRSNAQVL